MWPARAAMEAKCSLLIVQEGKYSCSWCDIALVLIKDKLKLHCVQAVAVDGLLSGGDARTGLKLMQP